MKEIVSTLFVLVLVASGGIASDLSVATNAYVRYLILSDDFRERWQPVMWENYSTQREDPNGGYLFRFEFRFNPEEKALAFIVSDRFGGDKNNLPFWDIYIQSGDRQWNKVATSRGLNPTGFHVDYDNRTIIQHWPERFGDGKSFSLLRIGKDGSYEEEYYSSENTSPEEQAKMEARGKPFAPQIEKIPIAAYLRDPGLQWNPLYESYGVLEQSLDDKDEALLTLGKDLQWGEAVALAKALNDKASHSSEPTSQQYNVSTAQAPTLPLMHQDNQAQSTSPSPTADTQSSPSLPIVPVVIIVAVVVGIVLYLLRCKSQ